MQTFQLTASEFNHQIAPNKSVKAWGFNQTVPGPTIRAKKGEKLLISVTNELPESTIVHWHGIRLPAAMDGTGHVQRPIQPGETFQYTFTTPDAGTFWYHSHQNETVQMEKGMYGAIVVQDDDEPAFDADRLFVIDDMKLNGNLEFERGGILERWIERHDGRQGEVLLLNGSEDLSVEMFASQTERWRFVNASSARYFRLYLGGRTFRVLATDGGFLQHPVEAKEILMTPGERIEIAVGPFVTGESFAIESLPYNRMTMAVRPKKEKFGIVTVGVPKESTANIPSHLRNIETLAPQHATPNRKIKFSVGPSLKHGIDFLVNNEMHAQDKPVKLGELQVWEVSNTSLMDHPFHLHGFFFQVIEVNGKALEYVSWKDTINLAPRSKIKIAWVADRTGEWMYHCHILEHHAAGMMGHFEVVA